MRSGHFVGRRGDLAAAAESRDHDMQPSAQERSPAVGARSPRVPDSARSSPAWIFAARSAALDSQAETLSADAVSRLLGCGKRRRGASVMVTRSRLIADRTAARPWDASWCYGVTSIVPAHSASSVQKR